MTELITLRGKLPEGGTVNTTDFYFLRSKIDSVMVLKPFSF